MTTTTTFVIRKTRSFYGPKTERSLVTGDFGEAISFASAREAQAYVGQLDSAVYETAHNESGRAEYKIIRADKLPAYLASQI